MKVLTSFLRQNENNVWIVLINWRRINVVATHNWWKWRAPSSTAGPNFFSILCQWIAPIDCHCNGECENKFIMPGYKTRFSGSSICSHILVAGPLLAHGSIVQECTTQVLSFHKLCGPDDYIWRGPQQFCYPAIMALHFPQLYQLFHRYLGVATGENNVSCCVGCAMGDILPLISNWT